jgi:hypothetical protein
MDARDIYTSYFLKGSIVDHRGGLPLWIGAVADRQSTCRGDRVQLLNMPTLRRALGVLFFGTGHAAAAGAGSEFGLPLATNGGSSEPRRPTQMAWNAN